MSFLVRDLFSLEWAEKEKAAALKAVTPKTGTPQLLLNSNF